MFRRHTILAAILLLSAVSGAGTAAAQGADDTVGQDWTAAQELAGQRAKAAFECAALAANTATDDPTRLETKRLFAYAYATVKPAVAIFRSAFRDSPWGDATELSDDFLIGSMWMSSNTQVTKLLEDKVPFKPGWPSEVIGQLREIEAQTEFNHRNCNLIGRD